MSSPVDSDWGYYPGTHGLVLTDTDPIIGAIDTGTSLTESAVNLTLMGPISLPSSGVVPYYAGGYLKLNSTLPSSAGSPRLYNRAGAVVNTSAGVPRVVSTNPADVGVSGNGPATGLQVRLMAQVGGLWVPQWINPNGTTPSNDVAGGVQSVDAFTALFWELTLGGAYTVVPGDFGCYVGSQLCAVIRGTNNPRRGITGQGNSACFSNVMIAGPATKNTDIVSVNRLTMPTMIDGVTPMTALGAGVVWGGTPYWTGSDQSIALPGGPFVPGDKFGYAFLFNASNVPPPIGPFEVDIGVLYVPGV